MTWKLISAFSAGIAISSLVWAGIFFALSNWLSNQGKNK